ncbi:hypothetical protein INT47_006889 [Mucor saturninus]|uniref:Uncharacterized protein n=1 Tax=Mucor saturninus TaxID=64648 RepID=A0A8H7VAN0_9FUNG|nr:hypothetical protein INT47_006889 [Mucor saturninus]
MTNKSAEWSAKKEKKGTSNLDTKSYKKKVAPAKPKTPPMMSEPILLTKPSKPITKASAKPVDAHSKKKIRTSRKSRSRVRSFISLSIVSYLGYHALYACGSPFENNEDKAAICAAIDPIKLDLYAIYQSNLVQTNAGPYLEKGNALYLEYGVPVQSRVSELYLQHGKPVVDQSWMGAQQVYKQQVEPIYMAKVAPMIHPYLAHAKPYYHQQFNLLLTQTSEKAKEARAVLQYQLDHLPPPIQHAKETACAHIKEWIHRAEHTDLLPILLKYYWAIVDFLQFDLLPVVKQSHVVTQLNTYYVANMKDYVDLNLKPVLAHLPVAKLVNFVHAQLPSRPAQKVYPVATSASTQLKTALLAPKTKDIPITPPAEAKTAVTITKSSAPASAATHLHQKPEPTIDVDGNAHDIVQEKSVKPTAATEYAPDAEKAEAIYVPTCNSAEEQLVVANTEKHLVAVPTDKEVFELHKEEVKAQAVIPPVKKETPTIVPEKEEEEIVFSIQTEVPVVPKEEEEVVFRIQTEVPFATEAEVEEDVIEVEAPTASEEAVVETKAPHVKEEEEETVFRIQTEAPVAMATEESKKSAEKENIVVPPAIQNEELVLESRGEKSEEPAFIKVDEPAVEHEQVDYEEPIVKVDKVEEPKLNIKVPVKKEEPSFKENEPVSI